MASENLALPVQLDTTPKQIGDGTKPLYITIDTTRQNGISIGDAILYGFGATTPTVWHRLNGNENKPLNVSIDFGIMWAKVPYTPAIINVSVGV
jgi:hypothetical protein